MAENEDFTSDETCSHTDLTDEEKFALIELVRERPLIWNQDGDNTKRKKRNYAFEEIAEIMNEKFQRSFKANAMKLGFRLLQISFLRENKKPGSRWKFLEKMNFILQRVAPLSKYPVKQEQKFSEILDCLLKQSAPPEEEIDVVTDEKPSSCSPTSDYVDCEIEVPNSATFNRQIKRGSSSPIKVKAPKRSKLEKNDGQGMSTLKDLVFMQDLSQLISSPEAFTANTLGLNVASRPKASTSTSGSSKAFPLRKEFVPSLDDANGSVAISQMVFNTHNKLFNSGHHIALVEFEQAIGQVLNRFRAYMAMDAEIPQNEDEVSDLND